jgi:hypothetical protein
MRQAAITMIISIAGKNFTRNEFKKSVHFLTWLMIAHRYNPNALNELFDSVWHPFLRHDSKIDRLVVVPPPEILEQCYKIDRSRRRAGQKEDEIEAIIMKWCNDQNVRVTAQPTPPLARH